MVVNADSMQVYRDLRVLTARPTPADEAAAPHRLYGHVDGAVNYSVGRYLADAGALLAAERRTPIFVGGTGLYFRALLDGLSDIPPVPEAVREEVRAAGRGADDGGSSRRARRPRSGDRRRARPAEPPARPARPRSSGRDGRAARLLPGPQAAGAACGPADDPALPRARPRRAAPGHRRSIPGHGRGRSARRGETLAERRLDPMLPVMRAHGVPALLAHVRGEIGLEEAVAIGQADTRRYAKRQFTWFRHQMPGWTWVAPENAMATVELLRSRRLRPALSTPVEDGMSAAIALAGQRRLARRGTLPGQPNCLGDELQLERSRTMRDRSRPRCIARRDRRVRAKHHRDLSATRRPRRRSSRSATTRPR